MILGYPYFRKPSYMYKYIYIYIVSWIMSYWSSLYSRYSMIFPELHKDEQAHIYHIGHRELQRFITRCHYWNDHFEAVAHVDINGLALLGNLKPENPHKSTGKLDGKSGLVVWFFQRIHWPMGISRVISVAWFYRDHHSISIPMKLIHRWKHSRPTVACGL